VPGLSGWERVIVSAVIPPTADPAFLQRLVLSAECPAGKRVLGGGFTISDLGHKHDVETYQSYPSSDRVWTAAFENPGSQARQVSTFAVCATVP
jgi:hypothetical protein